MTITPSEVAAVISAIAAIGAVVQGYVNGRRIREVHVSLNSRLTQLLEASTHAARANGIAQGRAESIQKSSEEQVK
jgi:hypothetical protein